MTAQSQPCDDAGPVARAAGETTPSAACDLCGRDCSASDFNDAADMIVCPMCLEDMIYAHNQQH
jgi:formylmethanofuran dehydrogenase subunit E